MRSASVYLVKCEEGYVTTVATGSCLLSSSIYDAKPYKRLGNAMRLLKDIGAKKVVEVAEDNFREWRGEFEPLEAEG